MAVDFEQMHSSIQQMEISIKRMLEMISNISEGKSTHSDFMDIQEVCNYTRLSLSTMKKYQFQMGCFKKGRKLVFKRSDVDGFMKLNTIKRI